ncbi:MAG: polysaccharide biosynthesis tyrosine autokinase [Acidiferrobacterales bacterium]|nr:polysaccharide biosynthesis tyrosine autokinase [Acidiferrobacterales bacterium]
MNEYYESATIDLAYYWQILKTVFRKNIRNSLIMATLVGGFTFLYASTLESQYRATTVMHVAPQSTAVFNLRELFLNRRDPAFRETQVGIMRSRVLVGKVVERLELDKHPIFISNDVSVFGKIKEKLGFRKQQVSPKNIQRLITSNLISEINIGSQRDSYLMNISMSLPDAQLAADITNALAEEYIESVRANQQESTEASEKWLLDRLDVVNRDLKDAEVALQEFKERENIIGSSKQNDGIVSQEVDMISGRLLEARQKRLGSEALYQQIIATERRRGDLQGITAIQNDPIVQNIRTELVALERRQGELSQRYGPEHRRMVELASQIAATNENLRNQTQRVVSALKSEYELAKESETFLKNSLGASTNKVQSLGRKQFDLLGLEQNVRTQRDVYQAFLKRLNESRATGVSVNENVRITDPAIAPLRALPSKGPLLVALFSLLTAMLGLGIGLLRELFDNTITNDQDVDKKLSLMSLGSVPTIEEKVPEGFDDNLAYSYFGKNKLSQFAESVRTIRSSLMLSSIDEAKRRILVTSTVPSEGKTSMAVSLAFAFGQVQKTLLIDCDLRRPSLDELVESAAFNRRRLGLNDLCLETAAPSECIHSLGDSGVDVILAGTINPNPQELFCSTKFTSMLNKLADVYDVIVIDSPPSGGLSDAMLLATQVDQVAYVVKANATPVAKIRSAIGSLKKANAPLAGVVVNQVPATDSAFSYYYGRGYYDDSVQKGAEVKADAA